MIAPSDTTPIASQVRERPLSDERAAAPDPDRAAERKSWPRRISSWLCTLLLALAALVAVSLIVGLIFHVRPMVVYSGSMVPLFGPGDIVLVKQTPAAEVRVGDVISFSDPSRDGETVTHRLIRKRSDGSDWAMVTRGDANTGKEKWKIASDGVVGRELAVIPKLGYTVAWLQNRQIAIALIVVCVSALAAGLLWKIWAPSE